MYECLIFLIVQGHNPILSFLLQFAMFFCAAVFLLITSRVHPYDKWRVNLVEWLMLLDLVLITAYFANSTQPHAVDGSSFGTFLFVLPYTFLLVYLVVKCFRLVCTHSK